MSGNNNEKETKLEDEIASLRCEIQNLKKSNYRLRRDNDSYKSEIESLRAVLQEETRERAVLESPSKSRMTERTSRATLLHERDEDQCGTKTLLTTPLQELESSRQQAEEELKKARDAPRREAKPRSPTEPGVRRDEVVDGLHQKDSGKHRVEETENPVRCGPAEPKQSTHGIVRSVETAVKKPARNRQHRGPAPSNSASDRPEELISRQRNEIATLRALRKAYLATAESTLRGIQMRYERRLNDQEEVIRHLHNRIMELEARYYGPNFLLGKAGNQPSDADSGA